MKRKTALLLAITCLLTGAVPACKSGGETPSPPESSDTGETSQQSEVSVINVAVDIGALGNDWVIQTLQSIPGYGTEFIALTETIPNSGQERDNTLTRLKTEIMAGKGPDVFLLCNENRSDIEYLLPFPQKAMKNHLLLPLDSYIENAEYMEWDKLLTVVMEAGHNEEGQQILPLTFTFKVSGVNTEYYTMDADMPMTWEESLACDDAWVRYSAGLGSLSDTYGDFINLTDDTLRISEEDIVTWYRQRKEIQDAVKKGDYPEFTEYSDSFNYYVSKGINDEKFETAMNIGSFNMNWEHDPLGGEENYWLAPIYNTAGGITATIDTFTAINRNTENPDLSFRILDYLLAYNTQRGYLYGNLYGMPVHMDVGMDGSRGPGWSMNDWNREQYLALREQINAVKFCTPVDGELEKIFSDYEATGNLEGSVHKHYVTALMMLAES